MIEHSVVTERHPVPFYPNFFRRISQVFVGFPSPDNTLTYAMTYTTTTS